MPGKKLKDAMAKVLLYFEELGYFLLQWDIVEDPAIGTMGVDYARLFYSPRFVKEKSLENLCAVLIHEVAHCMFLHPTELDRAMARGKDPRLWNVAQEMVANAETLKLIKSRSAPFELPGTPISPFELRELDPGVRGYWYDPAWEDKDTLEIYKALEELPEEQKNLIRALTRPPRLVPGNVGQGELNRTSPEDSKLEAPHIIELSGDVIPSSDKEAEREAAEKVIAVAKKMLQRGDIPAGLKRHVQRLLASRTPWERILHAFVNRIVCEAEDYRWDVPNFKHPLAEELVLPGCAKDEIDDIVVAIDTSGSISGDQLERFASEIAKLAQVVDEVVVLTTDAAVHERVKVREARDVLTKLEFRGGGGTDFRPVFETVKRCAAMIFFTDGCATYPDRPPSYPVLWVLTRMNQTPPWGKTVQILDV